MSDNDELDLGEGDGLGVDTPSRKSGGISGLLVTILKYVAIALGAIGLIVVVVLVVNAISGSNGASATVVPATQAWQGKRPEYSWFSSLPQIRTRTSDAVPRSVVVKVVLGYDKDSKVAQNEITNRSYELRDFIRSYFSRKRADELLPEHETKLKIEMIEQINSTILEAARIRELLFEQFDVVEM